MQYLTVLLALAVGMVSGRHLLPPLRNQWALRRHPRMWLEPWQFQPEEEHPSVYIQCKTWTEREQVMALLGWGAEVVDVNS
jgi:hypothetical protein